MRRTITIIIMGAIVLAAALTIVGTRPARVHIADIITDPDEYAGKRVVIEGRYMGWHVPSGNLVAPPFTGPPRTRSDWIVADDTGWIYVDAHSPGGCHLSPWDPKDRGKRLRIIAEVRIAEIKTHGGTLRVPYLYALECELLEG